MPPQMFLHKSVTVLMVGPTGSGKSSLAATLCEDAHFVPFTSQASITQSQQSTTFHMDVSCHVSVIEAQGLDESSEDRLVVSFNNVLETIETSNCSIDMIFYVVNIDQFQRSDFRTFLILKDHVLGSGCSNNLYIIFTRSGTKLLTKDEARMEWIIESKQNPEMAKLFKDLNYQYIFVENPPKDPNPVQESLYQETRETTRRELLNEIQRHSANKYTISASEISKKLQYLRSVVETEKR